MTKKPKKPPMMRRAAPGDDRHLNREMRRNIQTGLVFCDQVKERRRRLGLTQRQLAERLGIPVEQVRLDENDGTTNVGKVARYAKALECHPYNLLYPPEQWASNWQGF